MTDQKPPRFEIGEVAILQPPHPSAKHLWGQETTVLERYWTEGRDNDAMGNGAPGWSYRTDIPAPPISDLPEDQMVDWIWCEYDLKKKYDPGDDFESLMEELKREFVEY